jgi:hypothetical protein
MTTRSPAFVGEPFGAIAVLPSAMVLQGMRQVPVVEGGNRRDAPGEQPVDKPVIEVEAPPVDGPAAFRQHAGLRDRETVGADPEALYQVKIRFPPVEMVAGDRAPELPSAIVPGRAQNVSQIDRPRPSAVAAPSIW